MALQIKSILTTPHLPPPPPQTMLPLEAISILVVINISSVCNKDLKNPALCLQASWIVN